MRRSPARLNKRLTAPKTPLTRIAPANHGADITNNLESVMPTIDLGINAGSANCSSK
jgi:hypothetical protein